MNRIDSIFRRVLAAVLLLAAVPGWAGERLYLWEATKGDARVFLFGSVHLCRPDCFPLPDEVLRAVDEAATLAVELDPGARGMQSQLLARALYPAGETLHRDLSAQSIDHLNAALSRVGMPAASVLRMRPWMVVSTLTMGAAIQAGYGAQQGIDLWLLRRARAQGKSIVELETVDEQLASLDTMPREQQEQMVRQTLDMVHQGKLTGYIDELVDAWRRGDPERLLALSREGLPGEAQAERLVSALVAQRNRVMATRIAEVSAERGVVFAAVGALHFAGKGNILEHLQAAGFTVRQLSAGNNVH
ncbi:MAG: TraB/GumN family protein [Rhodocyclaceae bacterium]